MSAEVLAIVVSAAGVVVTLGVSLFAGFAWTLRRVDDRVDGLEEKLTNRIDALADDVTDLKIAVAEVKISVARVPDPPRHLIIAER